MIKKTLTTAAALGVLALTTVTAAHAAPAAPLAASVTTPDVILAADGCGPGWHRGGWGNCRPNVYAPPLVVAPPVVVAPPIVCGAGLRWHPRFRRCVVL
jgi:hypothetical protein